MAPYSVCWIRNNPAEEKIHSAVYPRGHDMPRNQAEAMGCSPHLRESNMLTQRKGRGTGVPETIREPTSIREPSRNLRSRRMRNPRYSVAQTSKSISISENHRGPRKFSPPPPRPRPRLCIFDFDYEDEEEDEDDLVAARPRCAVSRISKSASHPNGAALPTWKSATQQVWKPALRHRPARPENRRGLRRFPQLLIDGKSARRRGRLPRRQNRNSFTCSCDLDGQIPSKSF